MPDAYNPWAAPVFPTADDNAMQPETYRNPAATSLISQIGGAVGRALVYPGLVAQSKVPISTEDMIAPAFNMASMLTLGAGAAPQEANSLNMGIKAYHGSPHDFDKFDLSKIGTGEGAQAYGHGLYFAENPETAQAYRDALAGQADKGKMYEVNISADPSHFLDWDKPLSPDVLAKVQAAAQNIKPSLYERMMGEGKDLAKWGLQPENISPGFTGENAVGSLKRGLGSDAAASQALREAGIPGIKYLDEGSRNPWEVRQNPKGFYASEVLGPGYGGRRSDEYFPTHEAAKQWADQQQTRNYVVFNHDLIDIMRKYAVPGMLGAPILANALSEQKT